MGENFAHAPDPMKASSESAFGLHTKYRRCEERKTHGSTRRGHRLRVAVAGSLSARFPILLAIASNPIPTTLTLGQRLGPYEIASAPAAWGEVWKARDTRLDRSVAIKILPAEFAQNAQLKSRFERGAKTNPTFRKSVYSPS